MLFPRAARMPLHLLSQQPPLFIFTIDTEEEFDWRTPAHSTPFWVRNLEQQHLIINLCGRYGVVPTFMLTTPVLAQANVRHVFAAPAQQGRILLGTHLHSWRTPPYNHAAEHGMSYAGFLPAQLEADKLATITQQFTAVFGMQPRIYTAGRYGIGANTPAVLAQLGYSVDLSINARYNFSHDGGPDFRHIAPQPFIYTQAPQITALPLCGDFVGPLRQMGPHCTPRALKALSRLRCIRRVRLSPEGHDSATLRQLLRQNKHYGVVCASMHSSSLVVGGNPYASHQNQINLLLQRLEQLFIDAQQLGFTMSTPLHAAQTLRTL